MRRILVAAACAVAGTLVVAGAAFGVTTVITANGTWTAYPGQVGTSYQAAIQQPIDSANTSNWPAKSKGGIPIMFKLSSGTGPFVFESIWSDNEDTPATTTNDFSYLNFNPNDNPTLADVSTLIANYTFTDGDCAGGSLRWTIYLRDDATTRKLDVHYQPGANGVSTQNCAAGTSGTNMADTSSTDPYVVIQEFIYTGTPYTFSSPYNVTYNEAVDQLGALEVLGMNLIVDSGWGAQGDQVVDLDSATVGVANGSTYTETFTPQAASAFAPTCTLPPATLEVEKTSGSATGPVNEATTVQNFDTGNDFRVVDCKYQYVLSIPSLSGAGSYHVEIQIGGTTVGEANFDLK